MVVYQLARMNRLSGDPSWWPFISASRFFSYFTVAASIGMMYDWALSFGQEVELIWRQRWSLMTFLYLGVRYLGILSAVLNVVVNASTISVTDAVSLLHRCLLLTPITREPCRGECYIFYLVWNWTNVVVYIMLSVIMITRIHAMYQRSRKVLTFLVVIFLAVNIFNGVAAAISTKHISGEELILSGTYECTISGYAGNVLLGPITWVLGTLWEVLALCFAVWIAVKHFRELRQHSAGGIIGDCFTVLVKTHVVYFASFVAVSCFHMGYLSPTSSVDPYSLKNQIYSGFFQVAEVIQMFVLGPRLILGVREYHAKLMTDFDVAAGMTSIAFQERVHISTGSGV
ncbi:hypothetical protein EV702DRAFT_590051 [Suillus placidus]|uniref:DUF6533 domain-containing protein n=1 Tax=Suillus placidus TaxID=48579 RepID=A0A9P7A4A4_9AGAM|nr:hypothetical protein EV702DRAFT_590051 [Suillus placidus]